MGCACDTRPVGWRWERRGKDNEDWLMAEGEASSSPAGSREDSTVCTPPSNPTLAAGGGR